MVGRSGGRVAGKAEIITNSAQLGLGLGLSLAILTQNQANGSRIRMPYKKIHSGYCSCLKNRYSLASNV